MSQSQTSTQWTTIPTTKDGIMQIGVTGHRPPKLGGYDDNRNRSPRIKQAGRALIEKMQSEGYEPHFHVGMALGVDTWAAEVCIDMGIPFTAHLPMSRDAQSSKWPEESKERYLRVLESADSEHICHPEETNYVLAMYKRNTHMIEASDMMWAVYDGSEKGGTAHAVKAAVKKSKPTLIFDPAAETWTWKHRARLRAQ